MVLTCPSNPGEFLQPQESSCGFPVFPIQLLSVQKVVLCRSNLCVGFMCPVVLASLLQPSRCLWHLGHWPSKLSGLPSWQVRVVLPCCS